ncbi:MAG: NAD(P)H-hydrate epimerase [Candidatus Omnitrophica bacterium]|nr:NAD(P)H-hydrate epimerase [Candidatus Omnitrophota bacterium]MCB9747206.1 NAD(P)H-hydrate epimerase [Candidatus Omnitrophota bacterium]
MKVVTVKQIQKLDDLAIYRYGIPSLVLMENAGRAVAEEVFRMIKSRPKPMVGIVCGLGNNAGDGFVVARHLIQGGVSTKIFLVGKGNQLKHDAAVNYQILKRLKFEIVENVKTGNIKSILEKFDVVVDAIFGVGLNRDIEEPFREIINTLNTKAKRIVAVDIPSGLDGTTGKIHGVCIKAHTTVTFSFAKKGFYKAQGLKHVGRIVVADIGIPKKVLAIK